MYFFQNTSSVLERVQGEEEQRGQTQASNQLPEPSFFSVSVHSFLYLSVASNPVPSGLVWYLRHLHYRYLPALFKNNIPWRLLMS